MTSGQCGDYADSSWTEVVPLEVNLPGSPKQNELQSPQEEEHTSALLPSPSTALQQARRLEKVLKLHT
jgi:hypothetical protein